MDRVLALLDLAPLWPALLLAILVFSFAPHLVFQLVLLLYPEDSKRRAQLLADLFDVPRWKKPFWVVEVGLMAVFEAVPQRVAARQHALPADATTSVSALRPALYTRRIAVVVGTVVLLGSGLGATSYDAQPGSVLWPLTRVFYAEHARTVQAASDIASSLGIDVVP